MPSPETLAHLERLYAGADDPWDTHVSAYERRKFALTMASLPRARYLRGLEVGCGAGALTAQLAWRCDRLVAMDCTPRALEVAQARAGRPNVTFVAGAAPGDWPAGPPDLVVLSEVAYFLTEAESAGLARRLLRDTAPGCDVVMVNWLGSTGSQIGGAAAAQRLIRQLGPGYRSRLACGHGRFRIDLLRRAGPALP